MADGNDDAFARALDELDPNGDYARRGAALALRGTADELSSWLVELGANVRLPPETNLAALVGSADGGTAALDVGGSTPLDLGGAEPLDLGGGEALDLGGSEPLDLGGDEPLDLGGSPLFDLTSEGPSLDDLLDDALDDDSQSPRTPEPAQAAQPAPLSVPAPARLSDLGVDTDLNFDDLFEDVPDITIED